MLQHGTPQFGTERAIKHIDTKHWWSLENYNENQIQPIDVDFEHVRSHETKMVLSELLFDRPEFNPLLASSSSRR